MSKKDGLPTGVKGKDPLLDTPYGVVRPLDEVHDRHVDDDDCGGAPSIRSRRRDKSK